MREADERSNMKRVVMLLAVVACQQDNAARVEVLASLLGPDSDYTSVEEIGRYGCDAVPYLVQQLAVADVEETNFLEGKSHPAAMRMLWSIATLRYITEVDFYADQEVTGEPNSPRQQRLTSGAPSGQTKFFGIWPSRGNIYFARRSEQEEIILSWRAYSRSDRCESSGGQRDAIFWLYGERPDEPLRHPQ